MLTAFPSRRQDFAPTLRPGRTPVADQLPGTPNITRAQGRGPACRGFSTNSCTEVVDGFDTPVWCRRECVWHLGSWDLTRRAMEQRPAASKAVAATGRGASGRHRLSA